MEANKVLKLGYMLPVFSPRHLKDDTPTLTLFFSQHWNPGGRITLMLHEYLLRKQFDVEYVTTFEHDGTLNGIPSAGILKLLNQSTADIGVVPKTLIKDIAESVDFCYPYFAASDTFVTPKPWYKPQVFAIFHTLTSWVWMTILLVFIMMIIMSYIASKSRYPLDYVVLHTFAVLMRQTSIIKSSSFAQKILIYSWIIGAMFLCLHYHSIVLSFLAFPSLNKIKHLSDLAKAVEKGDYICLSVDGPAEGLSEQYLVSENKHLRIIGEDVVKHTEWSETGYWTNFARIRKTRNVAVITTEMSTGAYVGKYFISEDRFNGNMFGMIVRKDFCCKKLLDDFVHRVMASGIYFHTYRLGQFNVNLKLKFTASEEYDRKRKLTLIDVAPAFIFLLSGYFISIVCLFCEIWLHRKANIDCSPKRKEKQIVPYNEVSV